MHAFWLVLLVVVNFCSSYESPISLGFVLDSTGSMYEEMEAVKTGIRAILNLRSPLVAKIVVVAYRDPNISNAHSSNNRTEIEANLEKLIPYAGGDCPEMAMLGLKTAVELSNQNSILLFISDASAKDHSDAPIVLKLAERKNVTIIFFITGCCNNCTSNSFRTYEVIAKATKGRLYRIKPSQAQMAMVFVYCNVAFGTLNYLLSPPETFKDLQQSSQRCIKMRRDRMACLAYLKRIKPGLQRANDRAAFLRRSLNDLLSLSAITMAELSDVIRTSAARQFPSGSTQIYLDRFLFAALRHPRPAFFLVKLRNATTKQTEVARVTKVLPGSTPYGTYLLTPEMIHNYCNLSSSRSPTPSVTLITLLLSIFSRGRR